MLVVLVDANVKMEKLGLKTVKIFQSMLAVMKKVD